VEDISVACEDGVARVSLNRPEVRNAVRLSMWRELAAIFGRFVRDKDVRAVILTGVGGNFSVGSTPPLIAKIIMKAGVPSRKSDLHGFAVNNNGEREENSLGEPVR